jgi:hypothetical protein
MSIACDPTSLVSGAACLECGIPPGMQPAVITYLLCQIANGAGAGGTTQSATYPLTENAALNVNFAHGLGAKPSYLRAVLLCTTNDTASGTLAGQEIEVYNTWDVNNNNPIFGINSDTSKIYLNSLALSGANMSVVLNTSIQSCTSMTNFSLKVYWHA